MQAPSGSLRPRVTRPELFSIVERQENHKTLPTDRERGRPRL